MFFGGQLWSRPWENLDWKGWWGDTPHLTLAPGHPDPMQATAAALPPMPDDFEELLDYIVRNASRFADQARDIDLDRDVWVFDSVGAARFWLRQTIMEVAVHTWDATMAVGRPSPLREQVCLEIIDQNCAMQYHRGHWWGEPWTFGRPSDTLRGHRDRRPSNRTRVAQLELS